MDNNSSPKIILASGSVQRRKLMKMMGISFQVKLSRVQEVKKIRTTCAALVKENALRKARDVASRLSEGVVIGADTVVYIGNKKIIGKPRSLKEAKQTLKVLMSRPQWVYTGLAVIDKKNNKTITSYEKTKVHMTPLSDEQIDRYYQHISPLDKAGGFDIEGRGGLFIKKITGCYYNVIGLPMARLTEMLKKIGVHVLTAVFCLNLMGCATEYNLATEKQETLFYGTEKEIRLGESLSRQLETNFKVVTDIDINERVSEISRRIAEVCDRNDLVYTVKVIENDEVNAVSLPGGFIYIFKGLIDKVENDDQLAGVIGHEFGHITAKHSVKKLQSIYGYTLLQLATIQTGNARLAQGLDLAFLSMFMEHSRQDEFEADRLGVKYLKKAGYDPRHIVTFLKKLGEIQGKESPRQYSYWRTHPFIPQRIAAANQEISGQIEFRDYLNLTGEDE